MTALTMMKVFDTFSRLVKNWRLNICFLLFGSMACIPVHCFAHQAPYSIVYLDISPGRVAAEIQVPLSELELAYGNNISKDPETLLARMGPQLKEYLLAHAHAYVKPELPWQVQITNMSIDQEQQILSGPAFWELRARLLFLPKHNENTRSFMLDYDAVVHQVVNHIVFVTIRNDWETGRSDTLTADSDPMTIRTGGDNKVHPLTINLDSGSWWTGFKNMAGLGMQHIKEGTDHLLFLLVLLLPATLLVQHKKWAGFGGTKYSILRLLKIVTAFTIGHSVTLLIGAMGWVKLPQQPVEILIAFSILVSAVHAIRPVFPGKEPFVAAGFGLIHGLAFATVLSNMNLGAGTLALSILGFNLGIELMQLFIIAMIIPWLIIISKSGLYSWLRVPGAVFAGIAALGWIMERYSGHSNMIANFITKITAKEWWFIVILIIISAVCWVWGGWFKLQNPGATNKSNNLRLVYFNKSSGSSKN